MFLIYRTTVDLIVLALSLKAYATWTSLFSPSANHFNFSQFDVAHTISFEIYVTIFIVNTHIVMLYHVSNFTQTFADLSLIPWSFVIKGDFKLHKPFSWIIESLVFFCDPIIHVSFLHWRTRGETSQWVAIETVDSIIYKQGPTFLLADASSSSSQLQTGCH